MGNAVKQLESKVYEFENSTLPFLFDEKGETSDSEIKKDKTTSSSQEKENNATFLSTAKIDSTESEKYDFSHPFVEDSGKQFEDLFRGRDLLLNEAWDVSENIQGKVVSINDSNVNVDCLIDIELKTFQLRAFPIHLFQNINGLSVDKMVIIKTKLKAGAIRIDVYSGDGIVDGKLFKNKENWDSLIDSGLDKKLTKW